MLNKIAAFIKVEKPCYFTGSRTFVASTTAENITEIQLIPKKAAGSFTAPNGGAISIPDGGSIVFPTNAIVNTSNTAYTGIVSASAFFINPEAENFMK